MAKTPPRRYAQTVAAPEAITLAPIGVVRSPHAERHGTPHQPTVPAYEARPAEPARIELFDVIPPEALRDLAGFDRVWVVSWLHLNRRGWRAGVVPPRGPRVRRSQFATRAPHRPNLLGLSLVEIAEVEGRVLHLGDVDLLDGTPVLDLKPYIPEFDAFPDSRAGWLDELPERG